MNEEHSNRFERKHPDWNNAAAVECLRLSVKFHKQHPSPFQIRTSTEDFCVFQRASHYRHPFMKWESKYLYWRTTTTRRARYSTRRAANGKGLIFHYPSTITWGVENGKPLSVSQKAVPSSHPKIPITTTTAHEARASVLSSGRPTNGMGDENLFDSDIHDPHQS